MVTFCTSPYPFIILGAIIVLFCVLAWGQQYLLRQKPTDGFNQHSTRLLLVMLAMAIVSLVILIAYILGPQAVC